MSSQKQKRGPTKSDQEGLVAKWKAKIYANPIAAATILFGTIVIGLSTLRTRYRSG